ncbi:ABZJ_00895 family protein [Shimia sp. Alg240-R146]|uniref:ABZJ_00895 family protein n=1 Tax=Shimia sp. Alg240-R146 TaxID=2993449 RepID=UPI0022E3F143|nr:ABZJ_00895 family protein [Shimia sp. Alg240-R146]
MINPRRYAVAFVLTLVGLAIAGFALSYFRIGVPPGMNTWLSPAVGALVTGQAIARDTGAPLPVGTYWRLGVPATVIAVVLHLIVATAVIGGLAVMTGVNMLSHVAGIGAPGLAIITAIMVVAIYFSNVCFLWIGVRNVLRVQAKKASGA